MSNKKVLQLYGDIGGEDGITTEKVRASLNYLKQYDFDELVIRLMTYGGSVQEANGIIDALEEFKVDKGVTLTAINDCYVASAGANIFSIADKSLMTPRSQLLIHRAWTIAMVNSKGALELSKTLEKATEPSIDIYVKKSGKTREEVESKMDEESWMNVNEAIDFGLVDGIYTGGVNDKVIQQHIKNVDDNVDVNLVYTQSLLKSEIAIQQKVKTLLNTGDDYRWI